MPTSLPKQKPQPSAMMYDFTATELYDRLSRPIFAHKFSEQPPSWDKTRPIKRWFDSNAANLPPDETYVDPLTGKLPFYWVMSNVRGAAATKKNLVLTNKEAASFNLPGLFVYPKYVIKQSGLYVPIWNDAGTEVIRKQYVPSNQIVDLAQAHELIREIENRDEQGNVRGIEMDPVPVETTFGGPFAFRADEGETRRMWNVRAKGETGSELTNVGLTLEKKHAQGVGAPGSWGLGTSNQVLWITGVSTDTGEQDPRPEVAIPCRDLLPNERMGSSGLMGDTVIVRTDNAATVAMDDNTAMASRIREIHERVMKAPMLNS